RRRHGPAVADTRSASTGHLDELELTAPLVSPSTERFRANLESHALRRAGAPLMCGIAGIADMSGRAPVDADCLRRMTDRLFPRGPDDVGYLVERRVGLDEVTHVIRSEEHTSELQSRSDLV